MSSRDPGSGDWLAQQAELYRRKWGSAPAPAAPAPAPAAPAPAEERPGFLRMLAGDLAALGRVSSGNAILGPGDPQAPAPLVPRQPGDVGRALRGYSQVVTGMGAPVGSAIYHGAAAALHAAAGDEDPLAASYAEGIAPAAIRLVGGGDAYERLAAEHPVATTVGTALLDAGLGAGVEGLARGGARAALREAARPPVGAGGESIPVRPRALPPGRYEMGPEVTEAIPVGTPDPVIDVDAVPVSARRLLPAQSGGPLIPPAPEGSVLPSGRVDRLASGAVNQVRRTPPPAPVAPVPTEQAARLLAPEPELPLAAAAPEAAPPPEPVPTPAPEARMAAPEPAAPAGPRFQSAAATAYAQAGAAAQDPRELVAILANAATDGKVRVKDRAPLAAFLQQRIDELGGIPEPAPARMAAPEEAPPPRPTEPAPAPAARGPEVTPEPAAPAPEPEAAPATPAEIAPGATVGRKGSPVRYEVVGPVTRANQPTFKGPGWIVRRPNGEEIMLPAKDLELVEAPRIQSENRPTPTPEAPPEAPEAAPYTPGERLAGVEGREAPVAFPDNTRAAARYRVVEADQVQPSHDPLSFQRNPRFPEGVQGRDYHRDQAAQEAVATATAALDPERMLDPTAMIGAGPPTVTPDGIAVAGNQRSMMLRRAATHNPEALQRYRALLEERAADFGLDPEAVRGMKNPVLVRELQPGEGMDLGNRDVLRDLNTRSDMEVGKVKDVLSDAATRARQLTHDSPALSHLDDTMGPEETLRGYLRGASGRQFVSRLIEDGVIGKNEVPRFIDAKTNGVTEEGAQVIERTLLSAAVGDADVVARAPAGALSKLEHAVPAIVRTERVEGFNVGVALREALDLLAEKQAKGMRSLEDLLGQGDLLSGSRDVNPVTKRLAEFLDTAKPSEVKKAFRGFLKDAQDVAAGQGDLLGMGEPKSFRQAFEEHFRVNPAQRLHDEFGFALAHPIAGIAGGGLGALYGGTQGDTAGERLQNAALYGAIGLGLGLTIAAGAGRLAAVPRGGDTAALKRMADRVLKDGTDWMEGLGAAGKTMAGDVREIAFRVGRAVHNDAADLHLVLKGVSKKEREIIGKVINRRPVPELDNKIPRRLMDKADEIRTILDRSMKAFGEVGGVRRNLEGQILGAPTGSGKAFPQVPNAEGRAFLKEATIRRGASPRVATLAERMVKRGEAVDFEDAVDRIIQYANRGLRGTNGYLESTRFELPAEYVEWDPAAVLPALLEKSWRTVEGFRQWGPNLKDAKTLMARVGQEAGADRQQTLEKWFRNAFGVPGMSEFGDSAVAGAISNYETLSKLGFSLFSVLRNAGQVITNTADLPLEATARAFRALPPIAQRWSKAAATMKDELLRSGAVGGRTALSEMENRAPLAHIANLSMKPFMGQESMNHYRTALAARYSLEHDLQELARLTPDRDPVRKVWDAVRSLSVDPEGAVSRRMARMGIDDQKAKELLGGTRALTKEEIAEVAWKLNNDRNFTSNLATDPIWWSTSPWGRLAFKFKRFGIKQAGYVWDHVAKEAALGNFAPVTKFALATMLVGETYHAARDLALGEDRSATGAALSGRGEEVGRRLLGDIVAGGGFGMLTDLLWGVGDYLGGPAVSTFQNGTNALAQAMRRWHDPRQAGMAAVDFLRREVAVGKQADAVVQEVDRKMGNASNRYFEAKRLRAQARAFRGKEETPSTGKRLQAQAVRVVEGINPFPSSERTLSYRAAARQIDVGDVDDAATYLAGLLKDAETREERATILDGMYRSLEANAPLGPLNMEQEGAFYRSLAPADREKARRVEREWRRDYQRAIREAAARAR